MIACRAMPVAAHLDERSDENSNPFYQECSLPDDPVTTIPFTRLWEARFGPKRADQDLHGLEFRKFEVHQWNLDSEFSEAFPRVTQVLGRAVTFDVSYEFPGQSDHRNLFVFWRASDGYILTWVLEPPLDDARERAVKLKVPTLGKVWQHFGGFDNVNTWYMGNRDLPPAALPFDALFLGPAEKISASDAAFFGEFCDDKSFVPRLASMVYVGADPSGNYLALERSTELLFYLSTDGDWLGRRGVKTASIGSGDTSVYIIEGAETPAKFLELCAEHILKQLPATSMESDPATK